MVEHELYPLVLSSHRKNHSTESALFKGQKWHPSETERAACHLAYSSGPERCVRYGEPHHSIVILRKLDIGNTALEWFKSYLSGRGQCISIRGCLSERFDITCGFPQGSSLGPLQFTIYWRSLLMLYTETILRQYVVTRTTHNCMSPLLISTQWWNRRVRCSSHYGVLHCCHQELDDK